jgi:hypothetical protein
MPYPRRNRLLLSNRFSYLLHATFSGAIAAPLPASLSVDVGGPLTTVDSAEDFLYVAAGGLVTNGFTGAGDPRAMYAPGFPRVAGRALLFTFRGTLGSGGNNARHSLGWYTSATPTSQPYYGPGDVAGVAGMYIDGSGAVASLFADMTNYDVALILRATGAFLLSRPTASGGAYTLQYVSATGSQATMYPGMTSRDTDNRVLIDNLRVIDLVALDGRFASEYGLASVRVLAPATGTTWTATANLLLDQTVVFAGAGLSLRYRMFDLNNAWFISVAANGDVALTERVAGVATTRATAAAALTSGNTYLLRVIAEGNVHRVYRDTTLLFTYTDTNNLFLTETGLRYSSLAGGIVTDLTAWPRTVTLAEGV